MAIAASSFLQHGYAGTSMSAIAAALGGSKGTLWSYFPSKEALFEAVLDQATVAYRVKLSSLLDPCGDLERTLRSFCFSFLERITSCEAIALQRLIFAEAGRFPEIGRIFHERAPIDTQALLGGFLAAGMKRGLLRADDPLRAAGVVTSLCMAGCHQQLMLGRLQAASAEQIAADAEFAMATFLRAYAPGGGRAA